MKKNFFTKSASKIFLILIIIAMAVSVSVSCGGYDQYGDWHEGGACVKQEPSPPLNDLEESKPPPDRESTPEQTQKPIELPKDSTSEQSDSRGGTDAGGGAATAGGDAGGGGGGYP